MVIIIGEHYPLEQQELKLSQDVFLVIPPEHKKKLCKLAGKSFGKN
jgi:hypothetical protein